MHNSPTVATLGNWTGGLTPTKSVSAFWNGGDIPWVTPKDMWSGEIRTTEDYLTLRACEAAGLKRNAPGCIAVVFRSGILRHSLPVSIGTVAFTVNQDLKVLTLAKDIDHQFAYHVLKGLEREVLRMAVKTGTTVESVDLKTFLSLPIRIPAPSEQRRIAEILDAADAAIRKAEALIAKLKQMKAGLLHDLLTRGLDENGELRDPARHPEQFKDSPLGKVPKKWTVGALGEILKREGGHLQTGPFGSQLHAHEYVRTGIPVVMPQDITDGMVDTSAIALVSRNKAAVLSRHKLRKGDVVFARRGELNRCVHIGPREEGWLCGTGCLLLRPPEGKFSGAWLAAVYRHDYSQKQILARAVGSTMVNLNTGLLSNLLLALPSIHEQVAMVTKAESQQVRIRAEEAQRDKLKALKKGLMHDLLTGTVMLQ